MFGFLSQKAQRNFLIGLLVVLGIITLLSWRSSPIQIITGQERSTPRLNVENPSLKLDLLKKIQMQDYQGTHRNIFNASLPPPPPVEREKIAKAPEPQGPMLPPPPPELVVPFKFYGFSSNALNGRKRGFFTNGDDIWIVSEGDTIQNRFRVLRISPTTAEVEEIASSRRKTLPLEESAAPQG